VTGATLLRETPRLVLQESREHGIEIQVEDFHTGSLKLSQLRRLPVDTLRL
jgi:sensor c-di-GMP phosphodiesterase-like protein